MFHQYNFKHIDYKINHFQIPLGYISGYLSDNSYSKKNEQNKKYDFAFVGALKNDRQYMLSTFYDVFKKGFVYVGITDWSNPDKSKYKSSCIIQYLQRFSIYTQ